jgi:hypothetical protein
MQSFPLGGMQFLFPKLFVTIFVVGERQGQNFGDMYRSLGSVSILTKQIIILKNKINSFIKFKFIEYSMILAIMKWSYE